jgi:hypothetical protein
MQKPVPSLGTPDICHEPGLQLTMAQIPLATYVAR